MPLIKKFFHKIQREGIWSALLAVFLFPFQIQSRREKRLILSLKSNQDRFSAIHSKNIWRSKESKSGEGSELKETENIRLHLPIIFEQFSVKKVVDAPCGDMNWMKLVLNDYLVDYCGIDIVDEIVKQNIAALSAPNISFICADICKDKIPDCDLLIVRDCLFHLSFNDIERFFQNVQKVEFKFLLTTSHLMKKTLVNEDILTGDFRPIDLFVSPFKLKEADVLYRFDDCSAESILPREMVLISKDCITDRLSNCGQSVNTQRYAECK